MLLLIGTLLSLLGVFYPIQEVNAQTKFTCRPVVFNCPCGNQGYVFQAHFKQCHIYLPPEQACTKFQNCLECETGVDKCVSCPPDRYGTRCSGVCRCGGESCNRDTGQCEGTGTGTGAVDLQPPKSTPSPVSCTPPAVDPPIEQKLEQTQGVLKAVEYSCPDYFVLVGPRKIRCNDGKWNADPPKCRKEGCESVEEVPHGRIEFIHPSGERISNRGSGQMRTYPTGTVAVFTCNAYFKIDKRAYRTCLATGEWNGEKAKCVADCGISELAAKEPTILNGKVTKRGNWPWQAALLSKNDHIFCGGSLISDRWILTAAHCLYYPNLPVRLPVEEITVALGKYYRNSDDGHVQRRSVNHFEIHPSFSRLTLDNDIALLALDSPVEINSIVLPVCLTNKHISSRNIEVGKSGMVAGWGRTETNEPSDVLKETTLSIISNSECSRRYLEILNASYEITGNMFCAGVPGGTTDTCKGDSGGPFVFPFETDKGFRWYLEGIVSWGGTDKCTVDELYSGFTKVVEFIVWINKYVDDY